MSLQICIIDDNKDDILQIKDEILKLCTSVFDPIITTVNEINNLSNIPNTQIYFIDIDMPKFDGITVAKFILDRNKSAIIIFVSNREDLVFNTFSLNTFYFVRKASLQTDIMRCIKKYNTTLINDYIVIKYDCDIYHINKSDILWIESKGNNLTIHTNQFALTIRKTLKSLIVDLHNKNFIKIHNSFLVNVSFIKRIHKNTCFLINDIELPISPLRKSLIETEFRNKQVAS
ncbi:MAG: LytTR family DNA-binding domain-containing protein [Bacilli bacterium]